MPEEAICCDLTAIGAAGIASKAGAVRWANREGAAGWTSSLTSAVLTGSAFANGTGRGVIASVAAYHYSFMGATQVNDLRENAHELAPLLKQDHVDAVLLTPV